MRRLTSLFMILGLAAAALADEATTKKWNDVLRDVYIDGTLTRAPQTIVNDKQLVLLPAAGEDALVFDSSTKEVFRTDRAQFTFNEDRTSAMTPSALTMTKIGALAIAAESTLVTSVSDHTFLIHPHQSHAGPMTLDDLWSTAPIWRSIHDHYAPDADSVKRLRAIDHPLTLQIVFATWCGDSKKAVPRLLKAIDEAANSNLRVELYGIGNDFRTPIHFIQDNAIINVPIVIVRDKEKEIGRFIETPAGANVESDIAAIAEGKELKHPGRYERKELLASGTYDLKNPHGRKNGTEEFEIYRDPEGGILLHDTITRPEETIETFAGVTKTNAPDFAEVTYRSAGHVTRVRYSLHDGKWIGSSRSDRGGIVLQTSEEPAAFITPATASLGWILFGANKHGVTNTYVIGEKSENGIGRLEELHVKSTGSTFELLAAKRHGLKYEVDGPQPMKITVTSAMNLPVEVQLADGSTRELKRINGQLPEFVPVM